MGKTNYNSGENKEIDIRQFFSVLVDHILMIVVFAIVFACLAGGYDYVKQEKNNSPVNIRKNVISTIIAQNKAANYAFENETKKYTYAETPSNVCVSYARLFVDFNYNGIEGSDDLDRATMTEGMQKDTCQIIASSSSLQKVIDKLNLRTYDDMNDITPDELYYMIACYYDGKNVMVVTVSDVDAERSKLIAETVIDEFVATSNNIPSIDSVTIVDNPTLPKGGIEADGLEVIINKGELIKYLIIGLVGGIVLSIIALAIYFVFGDLIWTENDLNYINVNCFGIVSRKASKQSEDYKRLALKVAQLENKVISIVPVDRISQERKTVSIIIDCLKELGKTVSVINEGEDGFLAGEIAKQCKTSDIVLIKSLNIMENSSAFMVATNSEVVIFDATYGKTRIDSVKYAVEEVEGTKARVAGVIINNANV